MYIKLLKHRIKKKIQVNKFLFFKSEFFSDKIKKNENQ
jgi:hypothetical protein